MKSEIAFKFSSSKGAIAILEERRLFVTSVLDLNDPFEMRPSWTDDLEQRRERREQAFLDKMADSPLHVVTKTGVAPSGRLPQYWLSFASEHYLLEYNEDVTAGSYVLALQENRDELITRLKGDPKKGVNRKSRLRVKRGWRHAAGARAHLA